MKKHNDHTATQGEKMAGAGSGDNGMRIPLEAPCFVVGIGASVGGQEALEQIFTSVPIDCGVAFVVVMHLPPDGPSFLTEMLSRYTTMPVVTAEEEMPLQPNRVHVIPANWNLAVSGGRLHLEEPGTPHGVFHPVDRLFNSLAEEIGERAIAVVLSGSGCDGAQGTKLVKEAGGIVIVQEPGSAVYPAMPRSVIAGGATDLILPAEEIPAKIAEIARGECVLPSQACRVASIDEELAAIFGIVKTRTGHDFSSYKSNTVMRRIERRMAVNDVAGIGKYVALLRENNQEAHALCQDILIGVTSFFRDSGAFAVLRREIIPRLFAGRSPDDPVRIWHACCASGEEVYSMAMLIREYLDERKLDANVLIFATDIDDVAISQARSGLYGDDIEEDVGEERLKAFFTRSDGRWQVTKQLREMIVFAHHSLIKDPPFSRLDLLACRNFLIYLNPDMQKRLITLFHMVLKPGGILFLGGAETVGHGSGLFATVDKKWKFFERLEGERRPDAHFPFSATIRKFSGSGRTQQPTGALEAGPGAIAEKLLMERYSPPCVVVNEKYEVVHVSTRMRRFLEVPLGKPSRDILRMAREELRPALRAAIHKSFAEQQQVDFRGVKFVEDGAEVTVNVMVEPLDAPQEAGKLAMVVFEQVVVPLSLHVVSDASKITTGDEASRDVLVRQLEEQLRVTHEQLQATSEQLETSHEGYLSANEELMSINEEFQSANEELQSTNEELETSKEELQALNEELSTVNAELQGKVEELKLANSDMENLLTSSGIATIFLDRQLIIRGFTPAVAEMFNLIRSDIGRPFRHFAGKIDWPSFTQDAETVLAGQPLAEREVASLDRERCYLKRIFPYRTLEGGIDGIVVTFIDITERKRMEVQTEHLASFPQLNPNPVLEVDSSGRVTFANPAARNTLEGLGMGAADADVFLPADLDRILREWDRKSDATLHREISIGDRVYDQSIFLTPQFEVARIYAFDITERKRMEDALKESEERLQMFIEHAPAALAMFDTDMRYLSVSRSWLHDYGLGERDLIGLSHYEVFPEITEQWKEAHRRGLAGEVLRAEADRFERNDGSVQWVRWEIRPWYDAVGNIGGIVIFADDITDLKNAEVVLRRYELLAGHSRDIILFVRRDDGRIMEANAAAVNIYGYDHGELLGLTVRELRAPDSTELTDAQMAEADANGILFETIHRRKDGSTFPVEVSSQGATIGGTRTLISVIRDITERTQAEVALRQHSAELEAARVIAENDRRLLTTVMEALPVGVAITDVHGDPVQSNRAFDLIWNGLGPVTRSAEGPMDFKAWWADTGKPVATGEWAAAIAVQKGETTVGQLMRIQRFDGSEAYILNSASPVRNAEGNIIGCAMAIQDITELKRTEEELRRAHAELDMRVRERTKELAATVETLRDEIDERERMEASLLRLHRLYAVLIETDQAIIRANDRESLFRDFCRIAVEQGGFLLAWVGMVDEESDQVRRVAAWGATDYLDDITISTNKEPAGIGPTGMAVREGSYYICNDFLNDPCTQPWHEKGNTYGIESSASVALKEEGRVIGALTLYAGETDFFDRQHAELLVQMGVDISFALDNLAREARRHKAEQALREETLERLRTVEELREKDQMLLQQSRLAAMGEMINNIAHQWRQPLNVLGLLIQQMRLFYDIGSFSKEYLETSVDKSMGLINHMSQTIDDFRNFFKPEKEQVEFAIHEVVARTVSLVEDGFKSQQIGIDFHASATPTIIGFPNEYSQALLNILMNARDVLLERRPEDAKVTVTIGKEGARSVVTIADNAGGIAEEIMGKIFDPYFTTKGPDKGTGVGLFMSKTIIEKNMNGRLTARNNAEGAEFRIEV